jgi:hypothetical protein
VPTDFIGLFALLAAAKADWMKSFDPDQEPRRPDHSPQSS